MAGIGILAHSLSTTGRLTAFQPTIIPAAAFWQNGSLNTCAESILARERNDNLAPLAHRLAQDNLSRQACRAGGCGVNPL